MWENRLQNRHQIFKINGKTISIKNYLLRTNSEQDKLSISSYVKTKMLNFVNAYRRLHFFKEVSKQTFLKRGGIV